MILSRGSLLFCGPHPDPQIINPPLEPLPGEALTETTAPRPIRHGRRHANETAFGKAGAVH